MPRLYVSREDVKRTLRIDGVERDAVIDDNIAAASIELERLTHTNFIPETEERKYDWPQRHGLNGALILDRHLIALTAITKKGADATAMTVGNLILQPANEGPPYHQIDIDQSTAERYESSASTNPQVIRPTGRWGWSEDTAVAGTIDDSGNITSDAAATTFVCADGSLIEVGDTLLIETEALLVTERDFAARGSILINDASVTASRPNTEITVDNSHGLNAGEVFKLNSEEMFIESIAGNVLSVIRAHNGTALAAHNNDTAVHVPRTLTVTRAANGTTAATHADSTAISRYVPPQDIRNLCRALTIQYITQSGAGWTGAIGGGEAQRESRGILVDRLTMKTKLRYKRRS